MFYSSCTPSLSYNLSYCKQAETDSDESGSAHTGDQMSVANEGENVSEPEQDADQEQDLDASMDDLDEEGRNGTFDASEGDGEDLDGDDDAEM